MNNKEFEITFIRIARDVILQAAGKYEAPAYWVDFILNEKYKFQFLKIGKKR
jgi:hypothetical protein